MSSSLVRASSLEFRLRFLTHAVVFALGFWAPWNIWLHLDGSGPANGPNPHVWGMLSAALAKSGAMGIAGAFDLLLVVGIVCAVAAAWLRSWGSAYLGAVVVHDHKMLGDAVVADGPYRYTRNPLYLGTILHTLALALLMPPSGAVFCIAVVVLMQVRLILGEEPFLAAKLGASYAAYCAKVPRLLPALRPRVATSGMQPRWMQAVLSESYMWGVAASFAVLGWKYNALLLTKCVLVSLGVSLVLRGVSAKGERAAG